MAVGQVDVVDLHADVMGAQRRRAIIVQPINLAVALRDGDGVGRVRSRVGRRAVDGELRSPRVHRYLLFVRSRVDEDALRRRARRAQ